MRRAIALVLFASSLARAAGVAVLCDDKVAQFRETLAAVKEVLPGAPVIDPGAPDAAAKLAAADPAVVLAVGQKAVQAARAAAPDRPLVYCMVLGGGVSPSKTATGVPLEVPPYAQFSLWKSLAPGAKRVGVIYDARTSGAYVDEAARAAAQLGLTLTKKSVSDPKEVRSAFSSMEDDIDVLWLVPDPRLASAEMFKYLLVTTLDRKIALFAFLDGFTREGALASLAPDYRDIGRRAARLAAGIAGRPAAERVPVPAPVTSPGSLTINAKTAKQLGVDVPDWLIARARQVYR